MLLFKAKFVTMNLRGVDSIEWLPAPNKKKKYSCKDTRRAICQVKSSVNWLRLDRFHKNIPEHAFVTWLVIQNKPTARDMLAQWGLLKISDLSNVQLKIERKERVNQNINLHGSTMCLHLWE